MREENLERISSRQNPLVKEICGLTEKKNRDRSGLFRFDGIKLLKEALLSSVEIEVICIMESAKARILDMLAEYDFSPHCRVRILEDGVFLKISEEKSPEGVICVAKALDKNHKMTTINNIPIFLGELRAKDGREPRLLILSSLRDPGNVGTILRTAAAFGIDGVILSRDSADVYLPRTLRAAMGAIFRVPTLRVDGEMHEAIAVLRDCGRRVYATALDDTAAELGSFPLLPGDCFVIGNEGHGLDASVIAAATQSVYIPMAPGSESLNAAMAATVCMWELKKLP